MSIEASDMNSGSTETTARRHGRHSENDLRKLVEKRRRSKLFIALKKDKRYSTYKSMQAGGSLPEDSSHSRGGRISVFKTLGRADAIGSSSSVDNDTVASRKSVQRERSHTVGGSFKSSIGARSPLIVGRQSMPSSDGNIPTAYSDANAWLTNCIADKTASSSGCGHRYSLQKSKGPYVGSYQLLGDSLFVRFADQILKSRAVIGESGKFTNGLCVSGQTIMDLTRRINKALITSNVMVLIGTNNFLQNAYLSSMKEEMEMLLNLLFKCTDKVVLLTLPPIPRLEKYTEFWEKWECYNKWLLSKDNGSSVKVIDVAPLFLVKHRTPNMASFEGFMGFGSRKRLDKIHLNKAGLVRLNYEIRKRLNIHYNQRN